ncbi:MAG: PorP/SprF family type IX secretion system membrane protein [Prevotellaceae bacterium]|jgi:type IX secretion system PorP/SprF family membrane protein|nr:PorP/SprF family type IX secretion system membrane protein [Prevotellaceae bacterium]
MTAKIYIFIGLFLLFSHQNVTGQDIIFDHPYSALMYSNPAYTGIFGPLHAGAAFRSQFTATPSPYTTYYAEADIFIDKWNSGFGCYVLHDLMASGQLRQTTVAISYVFDFHVTENLSLRPAIQGIFHNRLRDFRSATFPDMFDLTGTPIPYISTGYEPYSKNGFDFSAGVLGQYRRLELGFSIHHLGARQEETYLNRSLKMAIQAKYIIPLTSPAANEEVSPSEWLEFEHAKLIPSLRYYHQEHYKYLTACILVQSGALYAGAGVKTALQQEVTNISLSVGFLSSAFRIGYTTDFIGWGSALSGWQGVSHELFVHFTFGHFAETPGAANRYRKKHKSKSCFGCYL